MKKIKFTGVVAMDNIRGIGFNGNLPWHCSSDLKLFRKRTIGHPVLMGRKTWESLPKKPLKGRQNIVLTRNEEYKTDGAHVIHSLEDLNNLILIHKEVMVIGGEDVYNQLLPKMDKLIISHMDGVYNTDATFPEYEKDFVEVYWKISGNVKQSTYKRK